MALREQQNQIAVETDKSPAPLVSIVTPAYNEAENLPVLYQRLCAVLDPLGLDWEWIVVDDHSHDRTFQVLSELASHDPAFARFALQETSVRTRP